MQTGYLGGDLKKHQRGSGGPGHSGEGHERGNTMLITMHQVRRRRGARSPPRPQRQAPSSRLRPPSSQEPRAARRPRPQSHPTLAPPPPPLPAPRRKAPPPWAGCAPAPGRGFVRVAVRREQSPRPLAVGAAWPVVLEKQDGGDGGCGGGGGGHRAAGPAGADAGEQRGPEPHQGGWEAGPGLAEGRPAAPAGLRARADGGRHRGTRGASGGPPGRATSGVRVTPGPRGACAGGSPTTGVQAVGPPSAPLAVTPSCRPRGAFLGVSVLDLVGGGGRESWARPEDGAERKCRGAPESWCGCSEGCVLASAPLLRHPRLARVRFSL